MRWWPEEMHDHAFKFAPFGRRSLAPLRKTFDVHGREVLKGHRGWRRRT